MVSRRSVVVDERYYSWEEYERAYEKAAQELGIPLRGRRRSFESSLRQKQGSRLAARARQLLWLERAERRAHGA